MDNAGGKKVFNVRRDGDGDPEAPEGEPGDKDDWDDWDDDEGNWGDVGPETLAIASTRECKTRVGAKSLTAKVTQADVFLLVFGHPKPIAGHRQQCCGRCDTCRRWPSAPL